jgi:PAS domain S-box-containing protein
VDAAPPPDPASAEQGALDERGTTAPAGHVLLVDDDLATLELAAEALSHQHEVRTARSVAEALAACRDETPACVVLDLGLPDADGVSGVAALADALPGVPVVVLTGSTSSLLGDAALRAGAEDYVHKDVLVAQLPHAVHYAVGRSQRRQLLTLTVRHAEAVLRALPDAAVVRGADGTIASANDAAVSLLGLSCPGGTWSEPAAALLDEQGEALAEDERPVHRVLRDGQAEQGRVLGVRDAAGALRWVEVDARPLTGATGDVFAVVESFRDVTAAREAQARLRFQADLLEAVGQAVIATDVEGVVLFWNAAAERLYGWSASEAVGRSILELTPAGATELQAQEIMVALGAGLSWTGDFTARRRDGSTFTALVTNRPLLDEHGQPCGVIGVSVDVTERAEAERAARRLAAVIDSTGDAVVMSRPDGTIVSWNRAAEQLFGWTEQESVGKHVSRCVPKEHWAEAFDNAERVLAGETVRDQDTWGRRRDGSSVPLTITLSPVLGPGGRVEGISSISATPRTGGGGSRPSPTPPCTTSSPGCPTARCSATASTSWWPWRRGRRSRWQCCSSTSTTSRTSTTPTATCWATRCCRRWPPGSPPLSGRATPSGASAATSSSCSCLPPTRRWPSRCPRACWRRCAGRWSWAACGCTCRRASASPPRPRPTRRACCAPPTRRSTRPRPGAGTRSAPSWARCRTGRRSGWRCPETCTRPWTPMPSGWSTSR